MAPHLPQKTVGIRPGEKLHEALITRDSANSTVEYADRYVVEPDLAFWTVGHHQAKGAKPVPEDFHYASDTNDDWLTEEQLNAMLKATP